MKYIILILALFLAGCANIQTGGTPPEVYRVYVQGQWDSQTFYVNGEKFNWTRSMGLTSVGEGVVMVVTSNGNFGVTIYRLSDGNTATNFLKYYDGTRPTYERYRVAVPDDIAY